MNKKVFFPLILALIATMVFNNVAYASGKQSRSFYHLNGTISSVDTAAKTIRVITSQGNKTIYLNADTIYRGMASNFSDLTEWMYVKVSAKLLSSGQYLAVSVNATRIEVILKVDGQVTAMHVSSFTILGADGNTYTFQVKAKTSFRGQNVSKYSLLRPGMQVEVTYIEMSNGLLRAQKVYVLHK